MENFLNEKPRFNPWGYRIRNIRVLFSLFRNDKYRALWECEAGQELCLEMWPLHGLGKAGFPRSPPNVISPRETGGAS